MKKKLICITHQSTEEADELIKNLEFLGYSVYFSNNYNYLEESTKDSFDFIIFNSEIFSKFPTSQKLTPRLNIPIFLLLNNPSLSIPENLEELGIFGIIEKNSSPYFLKSIFNLGIQLHSSFQTLKNKEKSLTENVDLMQNILDCSTDFIFVKDKNLKTILCNEMVAKSVGKKAEDLIGHNDIENGVDIELVKGNPEKGIRGYENDDLAALSGQTISNPMDFVYSNGEVYIFDTIKRPLKNRNGEIIGILGISRDVTEKVKMETIIQRNQKLESIGILAGGIAHDFNNLLAGIFGYLEIALQFSKENHTITEFLNKALSAFERAKGLTLQLLTFSKGGNPIKKIGSLIPILKSNVQFTLSGSKISVEYELDENLWITEIDENQIGQVIDNLVINAIQAMPEGGKLKIKANNKTFKFQEIPIQTENLNFIQIIFEDNGIGIPKDILPRIFDPFFSTRKSGNGLGLTTVFSIIQKHNGFIHVESTEKKGTIFYIYLPALKSKPSYFPEKESCIHKGQARILLMDDEKYIQEIESLRLEKMGYQVSLVNHGDEAISVFQSAEKKGIQFDLVILDLTITGGKGGIQTAEEIRKINQNIPIVVASGYSESPAISTPSNFGFNASLKKPYSQDELVRILDKFSL